MTSSPEPVAPATIATTRRLAGRPRRRVILSALVTNALADVVARRTPLDAR